MRTTTLEDRQMIHMLAKEGWSDGAIAKRLGWKVPTVRKWRRRMQREGDGGLVSKMGRPKTGALSTFSPLVVEAVGSWRQAHPGWGPLTLRTELEREVVLTGHPLPHLSSIARWLAQEGLSRPYERHQDLPPPSPSSAQAVHEEWELDARGHEKVPQVGVVNLINVNDRFSRVKLLSFPCWLGHQRARRHPNTADYQLVVRLTGSEWGLPNRLYVDRDSVFYDNTSKSPFPTRFHLWLLALGVELVIGPPNNPKMRGMTERSHQTWDHQVLQGREFADWNALYQALRRRRDFLNEDLPCATLNNMPPLVAHPEARLPRRPYRPEWETEMLDLSPVFAYLSQGRWFRKGSNVGSVSLGGQIYVLGRPWARKEVEITFEPLDQHLVFHAPDGDLTKTLPIKGLSVPDLLSELDPLVHLHLFQLALPFTWNEWRVLQLCESWGDTTY